MILSWLFVNICNENLSKLRSACEHSLAAMTLLLTDLYVEARALNYESLVMILVDHRLGACIKNCHRIILSLDFFF